ncbi:hypothetical protein BpHYR1_033935 [Brachionus plicatilis]|uniref:Uncharacterized protein n=1 Tax=Brachionus plicatilis TaxID=10195 RepID=A0A3M7T892_BRAPC|nr:hypothetical protein BpHYR1_033935 [Brachionus plicatilis]
MKGPENRVSQKGPQKKSSVRTSKNRFLTNKLKIEIPTKTAFSRPFQERTSKKSFPKESFYKKGPQIELPKKDLKKSLPKNKPQNRDSHKNSLF